MNESIRFAFGREGIIPDEWVFARPRKEVARSTELGIEERFLEGYTQDVAFEQSRLLNWEEATELQSRLARGTDLARPRKIVQTGLHYDDAFLPETVRSWPTRLFGPDPSFPLGIRLLFLCE